MFSIPMVSTLCSIIDARLLRTCTRFDQSGCDARSTRRAGIPAGAPVSNEAAWYFSIFHMVWCLAFASPATASIRPKVILVTVSRSKRVSSRFVTSACSAGRSRRTRPFSTIYHDARPIVLASGSPYSDSKTTGMASISTAHNMTVLCAGGHEVHSYFANCKTCPLNLPAQDFVRRRSESAGCS